MTDADIVREAAVRIHTVGLWLDLQADRIEVTGEDDEESRTAVAVARQLLGQSAGEGS